MDTKDINLNQTGNSIEIGINEKYSSTLIFFTYIVLIADYLFYLKGFSNGLSLSGYGLQILFIPTAMFLIIVTAWSYFEAKSQKKFFYKREKFRIEIEDGKYKFKTFFFINLSSTCLAFLIYTILPELIYTSDMFGTRMSKSISIILMVSYFVKITSLLIISKIIFHIHYRTILNSLKFVLAEQTLIFGPLAILFAIMGWS